VTLVAIIAAALASFGVKQGIESFRAYRAKSQRAAAWGLASGPAERIQQVLEREMQPMTSSPQFKKYFDEQFAAQNPGGQKMAAEAFGRSLGQALVARGIGRLSDADLARLHGLKKTMIFASERACPCYWDPGGCAEADIMDGLARLPEPDMVTWCRLSAAAAMAELGAKDKLPSSQPDFAKGLAAIVAGLPAEKHDRFLAILEPKDPKTPPAKAEQCFAIRTIFSQAELLEAPDRTRFVRALASLGGSE
jgi:hypothetical protein